MKMDDEIEHTGDETGRRELLTRAKHITDMLERLRKRLNHLDQLTTRLSLERIVDCLKVFHVGERGFGGIGIGISVKARSLPDSFQTPVDELPIDVANVKGLEYVVNCGILGIERDADKPLPLFDRLYILGNLCSGRSVIGTSLVKAAGEEAFLIVARKWLEDEFANGEWEFNWALNVAIKIAEKIPKREGEKLEFVHKVADVGADVRIKCSHAKVQREGLTVDAPAFEKRPVPKPEMPNGKTPKPIKR